MRALNASTVGPWLRDASVTTAAASATRRSSSRELRDLQRVPAVEDHLRFVLGRLTPLSWYISSVISIPRASAMVTASSAEAA